MSRNGILKTPKRKNNNLSKHQDPIEVFCRVRPPGDDCEEVCVEISNNEHIQLNAPKILKTQSKIEQVQCTFNKVFSESTSQSELFDHVGLPLVEDCLNGKNGLCFMYGITGSGKTHTMNGTPTDGGVLPRCLDVVFNSIGQLQTSRCTFKPDGYNGFDVLGESEARLEADRQQRELEIQQRNGKNRNDGSDMMRIPDSTVLDIDEDNNYGVFISFVEVYNNSIFDLLDDNCIDPIKNRTPSSKILREDQRRNMFVYDSTEVEVKSTEEAFELFWKGQNRRKTALTMLNAESSRSHCVFTIKLVQAPLGPNGESIMRDKNYIGISQLSLCDLAGSERTSRTKADGDRIRQAGHINNSLMTLRSCIETLRENQKCQDTGGNLRIVPYRDSKLTHLFKNYFDGDGKVRMIVCLNPSAADFDESVHVVKFAEMTQEVKVSRSEGVKFDLGLTPGRGKASKLFKDGSKDLSDGISSELGSQEDLMRTVQRFSAWPLLELSSCNDSTTLTNLMIYLEERIRLRRTLYADWTHRQDEVRQLILQLEQDNFDLTKALEDQRSVLSDREKETKQFEKKIRLLNEKYEMLQRSSQSYESQKRQVENELEKQRELVHKERTEKLRLKQALRDLTSSERLRYEKEMDKRVKQAEMNMEDRIFAKSEKLRQLRNVVQHLDVPAENQTTVKKLMRDEAPVRNTPQTPASAPHKSRRPPVATKPPHTRTKTTTNATPVGKKKKVRSRSPPASTGRNKDIAPVRAKHRRSRSSDYWLEHKPTETLHTDTIMQPNLKNKKTVNMPDVKDFKHIWNMQSAPNYMLTHQEEDSSGEIETKLIKGEVMKTRGGGASIQFTDIETLKKSLEAKGGIPSTPKQPKSASKSKKRKSEENEVASDDSWTSVETRCAIGIEGRPGATPGLMHHAKKSKH